MFLHEQGTKLPFVSDSTSCPVEKKKKKITYKIFFKNTNIGTQLKMLHNENQDHTWNKL